MTIIANTTLNSRADMIAAIRAMQIELGQPVCSAIDDQSIGQQIVLLQKYLSTVPAGTPSGFAFDPAKVKSYIADTGLAEAIIQLQVIASIPPAPPTPFLGGSLLAADAAKTWFNMPTALYDSGAYFVGSISSTGDVNFHKMQNDVVWTERLKTALELDDHNDAAHTKLPAGRIASFYSKHATGTEGFHYSVSNTPSPDTQTFNAEVLVNNGGEGTSYSKPVYLSADGYVRNFFRSGSSALVTMPQKMSKALATDVEAGTAAWVNSSIFQATNQRTYAHCVGNGVDRIDFFVTDGHPNEIATSVYHFYMQVIAGVERYFKSDGTEILAALPFEVSTNATLIDDTTGGRCWNWNIKLGADGKPRVLFTKYPSSTGARGVAFTDVEYWHGRWTGSAWVKTRLATGQISLYAQENHYAGGLCFDGNTTDTIYQCRVVNPTDKYSLSEWTFNETTAVATKVRDISTDQNFHQFRPFSAVGHGDDAVVFFLYGRYTTYADYATSMRYAAKQGYVRPAYSFTNAEATAAFAAMTAPQTDRDKFLVDNYISALKRNGLWTWDILHILALADSQASTINLTNAAAFTLIPVNSPNFLAYRGWAGNGTSSRLRTQFTPSTQAVQGTLNNYSLFEYSLSNVDAVNSADMGSVTAPRSFITPASGGVAAMSVNSGTGSSTGLTSTNTIGMFLAGRSSSTTQKIYKNGVQIGNDALGAVASTGLASQEQWVCGANATNFSTRRIAISGQGAYPTGKELLFYNITADLLSALGAI
jgi:hypothetical protein